MTTRDLKPGATVEINRKGLVFTARFLRRLQGRELLIEPITPGVNWRRVGSHMVRRVVGVGGGSSHTGTPAPCADAGHSPDPGHGKGVLL